MTADIGLSEAGCTTAVTLSQLVQSSSENDSFAGRHFHVVKHMFYDSPQQSLF